MNCSRARHRLPSLLVVCTITAAGSLHGFFLNSTVRTYKGQTAELVVEGPPGGSGVVRVNEVQIMNSMVATSDFVAGTVRTGTGKVTLGITGLDVGVTSVLVSGTYNGDIVNGSTSITVLPKEQTTANTPQVGCVVDPVNTATGEYFGFERVDIHVAGSPMPLFFARYAASRLADDGRANGQLGLNRLHNFASRIEGYGSNLREVILPDGRVVVFERKKGKWNLYNPLDVPFQLAEAGTNLLLAHLHTKRIWTYDSQGQLTRIEDGKGNVHTLTYNVNLLQQVSDGLGRALQFGYAAARLFSVTDHAGRQATFAYTGDVLTSATDPGGHVTVYDHSAALPTAVTRPEGNTLFTQIFTGQQVTSQTERGTDTSTLSYNGTTTTVTDPTGETLIDEYDASGRLAARTDEAGKAIVMTSDATGRRNSVTDRLGDTTTIAHHAASGLPAGITNAAGGITTFSYKARTLNGIVFQDLVKTIYPDGSAVSLGYDAKGNVRQITDQAGKIWRFTHNDRGQVLTVSNPLGGVSTSTYDAAGRLTATQGPDTGVTTYSYDARDRLTVITHPDATTLTVTYNNDDRVTSLTDERGNTHSYAYDANDRLTTVTDPNTNTTTYAYDVLDRVQQVTDRTGALASVTYNSRQLLASATDGNGHVTTVAYDARQRPTGMTDPAGKTWTNGFDDEGLLTSTASPVNPPFRTKRNRLGRPIEISTPLGHTHLLQRDAMQRVVGSFDPLGRAMVFTYDKRGLLTSATKQGTSTAKYTRNALGSLSKITDPNGGKWLLTYNQAGRPVGLTDPLGRKSAHAYDARGRRTVTTFADATTLTRTLDGAGNVTRRLFSDGTDLTFDYDNLNRLTTTNGLALSYDAEGRITHSGQAGDNFGATYDVGGRLLTVTSPRNGGVFTITYAYDSRNRLVSVGDDLSNALLGFTYDDAGQLLTMARSNGVLLTQTHDDAGRLTRIQDGAMLDLQYRLNAAGEVTSMDYTAPVMPGVAAATQALRFDKASQISTPGYSYDARGRLTNGPGGVFAWDGASRLKTAAGVTLAYNGLDDVITRAAGATTTRFFYNHAIGRHPIVAEKTEGGAFVRHYVWTPGGRLLYTIDGADSKPVFYHFDRLGSTLALSDDTGVVTDSYAYGPYGEPLGRTGASTQPFTYVGAHGVRVEGALYQMRARYYDPATARFLSPDPIWPSLLRPKRLNPYEYAAQSPGEFIDPLGRQEQSTDPWKDYFEMHFVSRWDPGDVEVEGLEAGGIPGGLDSQRQEQPVVSGESILDEMEGEVIVGATFHADPEEYSRRPPVPAAAVAAAAAARAHVAHIQAIVDAVLATQKPMAAGTQAASDFWETELPHAGESGFAWGWSPVAAKECPNAVKSRRNCQMLERLALPVFGRLFQSRLSKSRESDLLLIMRPHLSQSDQDP